MVVYGMVRPGHSQIVLYWMRSVRPVRGMATKGMISSQHISINIHDCIIMAEMVSYLIWWSITIARLENASAMR